MTEIDRESPEISMMSSQIGSRRFSGTLERLNCRTIPILVASDDASGGNGVLLCNIQRKWKLAMKYAQPALSSA